MQERESLSRDNVMGEIENKSNRSSSSIMRTKFNHDKRFKEAIFYLSDELNQIYPSALEEITFFRGDLKNIAYDITSQDTSKAFVKIIDGRLFIIRNMYAVQGYQKFATLIVELDTDKMFQDIVKNDIYEIGFYIDDIESVVSHNQFPITPQGNNRLLEYSYKNKQKDYSIKTILIVDKSDIFSELQTLNYLIAVLLLGIIPVFIFVIYFISKNVTTPINKLVEISKEIRAGNIGVEIAKDKVTMPNKEFAYLMVSFNKMAGDVQVSKMIGPFPFNSTC